MCWPPRLHRRCWRHSLSRLGPPRGALYSPEVRQLLESWKLHSSPQSISGTAKPYYDVPPELQLVDINRGLTLNGQPLSHPMEATDEEMKPEPAC